MTAKRLPCQGCIHLDPLSLCLTIYGQERIMFNVGLAASFTEYHTMLVSALLCAGGRLLVSLTLMTGMSRVVGGYRFEPRR